jgi:hypothetical protein
MPYRITGIDVHKEMLAVVVSDVEVEGEYQFERRMFGSNPEQLRSLAAWLLEQEVEEGVMESTAQYWKPVWEALERHWKPLRQKREGASRRSGTLHLAQAQSNRGRRGRKRDFPDAERLVKRLVTRELTLGLRSVHAPSASHNCSGVARNFRSAKAARAAGLVSPSASAFSMRWALRPNRSETRLDNLVWDCILVLIEQHGHLLVQLADLLIEELQLLQHHLQEPSVRTGSSGLFAPFCPLVFLLSAYQSGRWLVGAVGIESTNCMETKEFCGATWPSKVLKGKGGNS